MWQDTGVCCLHPPPALQSATLEEVLSLSIWPSAREDTHEHLLPPPEIRGLNAPVANWRVYNFKNTINSNIGDIALEHTCTAMDINFMNT